jgi:hypothetical protein
MFVGLITEFFQIIAYNFEVVSKFLENFCVSALINFKFP